ncbi:hypothetical protein [Seonamhaeicola sp. ML3]|uniref:hypothetical protein n=1 Tax=Seonamhaeicola sp. ML3 TaxID=2937786 RepID=UPI00200FF4DA|nr:hypothetical protein [Seonamhaeicola sp. ML3]
MKIIFKTLKTKKDKLYNIISYDKSSKRGKLGLEGLILKYINPSISTTNMTAVPTRWIFDNVLNR